MARRKKTSAILTKAQQRLSGLKSIAPKVDLGNGVTSEAFGKEVSVLQQKIEDYNTLLSTADDAANEIEQIEKQLSVSAENVLIGVKMKYGKDSSQYEMVGGTRQSDRRRRKDSKPAQESVMA
ncbi:MAG: hypothetical protein WBD47_16675 [Phormidesmis sp.]